jgi:transposase
MRVVVRPWRVRQDTGRQELRPSRLARLVLQPAGGLTEAEREALEGFLSVNPLLVQGYALKTRFRTLLTERDVPALESWLQAAEPSELPSFQAVARSFCQDDAAIQAAQTTPWSTGPCEGQICCVKLIKQSGYGRATLDLLRQRILQRMTVPVRPVKQRREVGPPAAA